jgi:hypothetical protein
MSYTNNPFAGLTIANLCVVVTRGAKKPILDELRSNNAL